MKPADQTPLPYVDTSKTTRPVYIITGIIVFLILYLAGETIIDERSQHRAIAEQKLQAVVDLAADDIARSLGSARDSLRLLSRMPQLRETRPGGNIQPWLGQQRLAFDSSFQKVLNSVLVAEAGWNRSREQLLDGIDWCSAAIRRVGFTFGLVSATPSETTPSEIALELPPALPNGVSNAPPVFLPKLACEQFQVMTGSLFDIALLNAGFLDLSFDLGTPVPGNLIDAEGLLRVSLNDRDLIRSVAIQDLKGKRLAEATEIGQPVGFLTSWLRKVRNPNRPFFSGPVWFDEGLGRPLWQAAVPLRDLERRPFAMLTSQIDLGFLQELAAKSRISSASQLVIIDEEGTVIGHPRPNQVAMQINISHSNRAAADAIAGHDGIEELRIGGSSFLVAYRHLKNVDQAMLPGWGVLLLIPSSEAFAQYTQITINTLALSVIALYIVFQLSSLIISSLEEDLEG